MSDQNLQKQSDQDNLVSSVITTEASPSKSAQAEVHIGPVGSNKRPQNLFASLAVLIVLVAALGIYHLVNEHSNKPQVVAKSSSTPALIEPSQVDITSAGFVPATISVKIGQAVVWTNEDTAVHTVASDPYPADNILPTLNSKQSLDTNDSYTFIFNHIGTFTYHDNLNPGLEGTVIVK